MTPKCRCTYKGHNEMPVGPGNCALSRGGLDRTDTRTMERTTTNPVAETNRITRCAVCKIDLKRRFTYIDDHTEELLEATREELFGKPFIDCLDPADHPAFNELFARYSRYEATFDAISITLVGKHGRRTPVKLIVSMNFIGGSPVNYQIVIDLESVAATNTTSPSGEPVAVLPLLTALIQVGAQPDWSQLVPHIRQFARADIVQIFRAT